MPRLHGERVQDFWARRAMEDVSREITAAYLSGPRLAVQVAPPCQCSDWPRAVPHEHTREETIAMLRRRGLNPEKFIGRPAEQRQAVALSSEIKVSPASASPASVEIARLF